jgi:hypothetical protein
MFDDGMVVHVTVELYLPTGQGGLSARKSWHDNVIHPSRLKILGCGGLGSYVLILSTGQNLSTGKQAGRQASKVRLEMRSDSNRAKKR